MESEMEVTEMDNLVGFRFKPTNEEIIRLLKMKRLDPDFTVRTVKEIDFYRFDPWELPWIQSKESVCYFYCKPYNFKNYKNSKNRKTKSGSWKINGRGSQMKAKNNKVVIGSKRILSFCPHGTNSKKAKAEYVMHEIHIEDNRLYKEDFVVCRVERRRVNSPSISSSDDSGSSHLVVTEDTFVPQPNQQLVPSRNHVAEKPSLLLSDNLQVEDQPLSQYLTSDYSNHAAEKTLPTFEDQTPDQYLTSDYNNHAVEKTLSMLEDQPPSQYLTSYYSNHVAEKTLPTFDDQLPSQYLTSDYSNHAVEKTLSVFEYQPPSQCLTSNYGNHAAEKTLPTFDDQPPGQYLTSDYSNHVPMFEDQPLSQYLTSDYSNHAAEKTLPTFEDQTPDQYLTSDYNNHAVEKTLSMLEDQPPSQYLTSYYNNHVAEKTLPTFDDQLPSQYLTSDYSNHAVEKTLPMFEDQPPSQCLTSNYGNHAAEKTLPTFDDQPPSQYLTSDYSNHVPMFEDQPPSQCLISNYGNNATEKTLPTDEFQRLPSLHLTSDFSALAAEHSFPTVESMLYAQFDPPQGSNGLNYNSLPALQSPIDVGDVGSSVCNGLDHNSLSAQKTRINPGQITSSYFDGFSELEELNSEVDFQDKYPPLVEAGNTLSPLFNSFQSVTEIPFVDSSFTNAETFNSFVNVHAPIDSEVCYIDSIWT